MKMKHTIGNPISLIGGGKSLIFSDLHNRKLFLLSFFLPLCLVGMACFFVSCGQDDLSGQEDGITRGEQTDSTTHITVLTDTTWAGTREYEY